MTTRLIAAALIMVLTAPAFAAPAQIAVDPQGRPMLYAERFAAFWIWRDDKGYHLRATNPGPARRFSGWVELDRDFAAQAKSREGNDYIRTRNHRIEFSFKVGGNADGFDFNARWPHPTTFSLQIEGMSGRTLLEHIFIGKNGLNPSANLFTVTPPSLGLDPEGRPLRYSPGEGRAYWIWRDGVKYFLRVTTSTERHVFSGWVEAEGGVNLRSEYGLEKIDFVVQEGDRTYFHLVVRGSVDGFEFSPKGSGPITFFLMVDGDSEDVLKRVFVGRRGESPKSNPFRVRR